MKKTVALILAALLVLGILGTSLAQTVTTPEEIIIDSRYSHTSAVGAELKFSGGNAVCSGYIKPSGSYSSSVTVTLYKQNGSKWDYVTSWSGSATSGDQASAGGSKSVGSGTYKVTTSGTIKSGSTVLENVSKSTTGTK